MMKNHYLPQTCHFFMRVMGSKQKKIKIISLGVLSPGNNLDLSLAKETRYAVDQKSFLIPLMNFLP